MTAVLVDDDARVRITTAGLDELLFVEAGAGTGKTQQLVDRVVALVLDRGVAMREIAAITFTEAAASELRGRIREAFERLVHDDAVAPDRRAGAELALVDLDGAAIGTVHSFAQRILAEHPVEAHLPPNVEVLDEVESLLAFGRRWEAKVDEMFADERLDEVIALASRLGIRLDDRRFASLRDVAAVFSDNWDRLDRVAGVTMEIPPVDRQAAITAIAEFGRVLDRCRAMDDKLAAHWLAKEESLLRLAAALDTEPDRRLLVHLRNMTALDHGTFGRADAWGGPDGKEAARACAAAVDTALDDVREALTDAVLRVLAGEVARFTLAAAEERRREGRLEFHDLLVLARRLLRNSADARAALHERYVRLLIDEFQDTDPIQIELAMLVAAAVDGQEPPADWWDIEVDSRRLFFVGDPKQSIYRFRRADIGLFLEARRRFSGGTVRLSTNFRTVAPLVTWVNDVFGRLMADERPGEQPGYEPLAAHRPDGPAGHRVALLGAPHPKEEGLTAPALRELEAATVADAVAGILAEPEQWPVEDAAGWRDARAEDIAILLPTRTSLTTLMDALRARNVEFRAETGTLVYETQEIRDLVAILRAVAHGADAVSLVAALRSPILACGDDDLLTYAAAGGRWDLGAVRPDLDPTHPVVAALDYLDELRAARWWTPPSVLIERIVHERRVMTLAFAARRARDVWRRIRFLVDQARLFEASQSADLVEFVAWTELQRSDMARVHEPLLPESDDHAVRIMTMHGAKGLEFPITVLSGLTTEIGRRRPGVHVLWGADDDVFVSMRKDVASEGFDRRADLEEEMDRDEKLRLLYVACTRARDHLLVSVHHKSDAKKDSFARLLWQASADAAAGTWEHVEVPADRRPASTAAPAPEPPAPAPRAEVERVEAEWRAERDVVLRAAARRRTVSATVLKHAAGDAGLHGAAAAADVDVHLRADGNEGEDRDADDGAALSAVPAWRRGRGATAFGRAVHAVLQDVDLASGDGVEALAAAAAVAEGVADQGDDIAAAVRRILAAPSVRTAATARVAREMYVAAPVGDRVVEGYVDLLVRAPEGLTIVDYKTDHVAGDREIDARASEYALQLAAYAAAVEGATGEPVREGVLVFGAVPGVAAAVERRFTRAELDTGRVAELLALAD
jgi:ATP-dependent exoDNAse (exonuclease V) beta subunit